MTRKIQVLQLYRLCIMLIILIISNAALAQTTAFTYQGKLTDAGNPANGNYDLQFKLFDALSGGVQQGATLTRNPVAASAGIFTVTLDFGGSVFNGAARYLEIGVRPASSPNPYTTLSPRQPITSTPYAIRSASAANADNAANAATATNATQLGGVAANQYVLTTDPRMTDARNPLPGSPNYIQNTAAQQAGSNFNISGNGSIGGTLGIGGMPSIERLRVQTATNSYGLLHTDGTVEMGTFVGPALLGTTGGAFGTKSNHSLRFLTNGSTRMVIGADGKVRIGDPSLCQVTSGQVCAISTVSGGSGVLGVADLGRNAVGVAGSSQTGTGLLGVTDADYSNSDDQGAGVTGISFGPSNGVGVYGRAFNPGGTGVFGVGQKYGVYGTATDGNFWAGYFTGKVFVGNRMTVASIPLLPSVAQVCFNTAGDLLQCGASSLRLKQNVQPYRHGLDIVLRLRPISFNWKESGLADFGLGAEDVAQVAPALTFTDEQGEVEGVKYDRLNVVLINAVKEQQAQIETLRAENRALEARLRAVEKVLRKKASSREMRARDKN